MLELSVYQLPQSSRSLSSGAL